MTKQANQFTDSADRPALDIDEIVVTPEMIEAGFAVLTRSWLADEYSEADRHTVADIYRAMRQLEATGFEDPP